MTEQVTQQANSLIKDFAIIISSPISFYIGIMVLFLTLILASTEIKRKSNIKTSTSLLNEWSFIYTTIYCIGNYFSSIFVIVPYRNDIQTNQVGYAMLATFVGVFAFKSILAKLDITFYKKGFLTIDTWIEHALNNALQSTTSKDIDNMDKKKYELLPILLQLDDEKLNAYLTKYKDTNEVKKLEADAKKSNSDIKTYKALVLLELPIDTVKKIISQIQAK